MGVSESTMHEEPQRLVAAIDRLRRIEAMRWTGAMMALAPLIAWAALFGAMFTRMLVMPSGRNAAPDWILVVLGVLTVASLPLLPLGCAFLVVGVWRRSRAERAGVRVQALPLIPLETGERLGQWVVQIADEDQLLLRRQPIHRWFWNPVRIVIRLAQGVMIASAMEAGYAASGVRGAAVGGAIAIIWATAWSFAMVESRVRLLQTSDAVEVTTSIDPLLPSWVRRIPLDKAVLVLGLSGEQGPILGRRRAVAIRGLASLQLGLWQKSRIAEEFRVRAGLDSPH